MSEKIEFEGSVVPNVTYAGIDKDIVAKLPTDNIMSTINDESKSKRAMLNFFCELLSEVKTLTTKVDDFSNIITICSSEKVTDYFMKIQDNNKKEQQRKEFEEKLSLSHKKPKKKKEKSV